MKFCNKNDFVEVKISSWFAFFALFTVDSLGTFSLRTSHITSAAGYCVAAADFLYSI